MARVLAAIFGVAALGLAGCGGGGSGQSLSTSGGKTILDVPISLGQDLVSPKYTRLTFPGAYLVQIRNDDPVGRTVTITHKSQTFTTPTIAPGKTYEVTLALVNRGDYTISYPVDGKDVTGFITMGSD
jgi:uncharacterized cupredoxin-like copper-binding protein